MEVVVVCVLQRLRSSGVASMEQMEQLLPGPLRTTSVIRANPLRYSGGEGGGGSSLLSETSSYHSQRPNGSLLC